LEILFCDACDGSISRSEIDEGRAVRIGGRLFHRSCVPRTRSTALAWLPYALLAPALAAGFALGALLLRPAAEPGSNPSDVEARFDALEDQLRGVSVQIEAAVGETKRQDRRLAEAIAARDEALVGLREDLAALAGTVERLVQALREPPPAPVPAEGDTERLAELLREITSADFGERFGAIRELALRPEDEAIRAVRGRLADPDRRIRVYALWQLGERADEGSAGEMVALLSDADGAVRAAAHRALRLVSGLDFPFDALAAEEVREEQAGRWEKWWLDRSSRPDDGD